MRERSALGIAGRVWRRGGAGRVVLGMLALGTLWLTLVPVHSGVARLMMERFHLRGGRVRWALLQPLPSMYNFANVVRVDVPGGRPEHDTLWLNHYPLRAITYTHRHALSERAGRLRLETRYGALRVVTVCRTTARDGAIAVACEEGP